MKLAKYYFSLFFCIGIKSTFAFECENVDLRLKLNPEIKAFFSHARFQNDSNWCYAYATSDLLSYKLNTPVSPTHLAVEYNKSLTVLDKMWRKVDQWTAPGSQRGLADGGLVGSAIKMAQQVGSCPENLMPSQLYGPSFKKSVLLIQNSLNKKDSTTIEKQAAFFKMVFPSINADFLAKAIGHEMKKKNPKAKNLIETLTKISCQSDLKYPNEKLHTRTRWRLYFNLLSTSHQLLNRANAEPFAILYHSAHIYQARQKALAQKKINFGSVVGDHVSTIWGRRKNEATQECEFLLRDSLGPKCQHYESSISCEQNGWIWVPEKKYHSMLRAVTYFVGR